MIDRKELIAALARYAPCEVPEAKPSYSMSVILAAARAHLATLPKTKMVKAWAMEYTYRRFGRWAAAREYFESRELAERAADEERKPRPGSTYGSVCVKVFEVEHEVPDDD